MICKKCNVIMTPVGDLSQILISEFAFLCPICNRKEYVLREDAEKFDIPPFHDSGEITRIGKPTYQDLHIMLNQTDELILSFARNTAKRDSCFSFMMKNKDSIPYGFTVNIWHLKEIKKFLDEVLDDDGRKI